MIEDLDRIRIAAEVPSGGVGEGLLEGGAAGE
jgi:hypothetical protein